MQRYELIREAANKVCAHLVSYLEEHGIDTSKNFSCINPEHEDSNPSCGLLDNKTVFHCFGCGAAGNIFHAAHFLEEKPIRGVEWIEQSLKPLAEKYNVELQLGELSQEDIYKYNTYSAYADAANIIVNLRTKNKRSFNAEYKRREWDLNILKEAKIGTVDYDQFISTLQSIGWDITFLEEIDLTRSDIFNNKMMIFTVCDDYGRPVGFAARNLHYNPNNKNVPKYTNQRTTGLKCNIYQKGKRLYNLHRAKKFVPPLYIMEGYADVITANHYGIFNCVAIGGIALTDEHIMHLKEMGIYDVILCLDSDDLGQQKTEHLLDTKFSNHKDITVQIVVIPKEKDPDEFLRVKGVEEFHKLKKWDAFGWRLNRYHDQDDAQNICNTMIPLIVCEPNYVRQEIMANELSEFVADVVSSSSIMAEVRRISNLKDAEKYKEKDLILEHAFHEAKQNPEEAANVLSDALNKMHEIDDKYDEDLMSESNFIEFVKTQKNFEEDREGFAGFFLESVGFGQLGKRLDGDWKKDVFMCFGGVENVGKTSMMCQLAYEIANNEKNNACVIYHSIDDTAAQILPRFVIQGYGGLDLAINQVVYPKQYINKPTYSQIIQFREMGYKKLFSMARDGRLIIKDIAHGTSLAYGESLIRYYQKRYPSRHIVYILDNFHKAADFENSRETRTKYKKLSNYAKSIATKLHVTIIATVEYTKLEPGTKPNNSNIAESRAIQYDANFIAHLYNDVHAYQDKALIVHEKNGEVLPRIQMIVGKNKISSFKGNLMFDLYPASGRYNFVDIGKAREEYQARKERFKEENVKDDAL